MKNTGQFPRTKPGTLLPISPPPNTSASYGIRRTSPGRRGYGTGKGHTSSRRQSPPISATVLTGKAAGRSTGRGCTGQRCRKKEDTPGRNNSGTRFPPSWWRKKPEATPYPLQSRITSMKSSTAPCSRTHTTSPAKTATGGNLPVIQPVRIHHGKRTQTAPDRCKKHACRQKTQEQFFPVTAAQPREECQKGHDAGDKPDGRIPHHLPHRKRWSDYQHPDSGPRRLQLPFKKSTAQPTAHAIIITGSRRQPFFR